MRVVHVAPTSFGRSGTYGGGERYPLELAAAVARYVDCTLVTFARAPAPARPAPPLDAKAPLRVQVLPPLGHVRRHPAHPISPRLVGALAGADIVHAHQLWALPTRVTAVTAQVRGQAVAVTDHGLLARTRIRVTHRMVDRFLTVSRHSADVLGAPPPKTTVIYGGVDTQRFCPTGNAEPPRAGVLFVGRITPHKGIDRLVKALPPGASLTVAGTSGHDPGRPESGYPELLRALAATREVRFEDAVSDERLLDLYRRAAVLVLPSVDRTCYGQPVPISELLGMTVLEAMACGTPVVASRIGGLPEVVEDGVTGFLVEPGKEQDLNERLAQLLANTSLAHQMGDNARQRAVEQFTWDACALRCIAAYEGMLKRPLSNSVVREWPKP